MSIARKTKSTIFILFSLLFFFVTTPIFATVTATPTETDPFCEPGVSTSGIKTALGCIKVGTGSGMVETILKIATGVGGGIALMLILYGVFAITTSSGSPEKIKAGKEVITSAIIGLIFILLSVFLINLIGVNILGIPGLS